MLAPGDHQRSLESDGRTRTYLIHVPPGCDTSRPMPLVLVLHGGGTNAKTMVRFCGLNETADRAGFLAVYPSGTGRNPNFLTWNAGTCCGEAQRQNSDDVSFIRAVLDDLASITPIDEGRVFAAGMSNGGMLAYRLACELSDRIAAITSVAGPMAIDDCRPDRPVSILHFHGTADEFAPYAGGRGPKSMIATEFRPVDSYLQFWVTANGCPPTGTATRIVPSDDAGGLAVDRQSWGPGREGSEVVLYTIHGGGHTWPGRVPLASYLGPATTAISANDLLWGFFRNHSK
jgi:polyhydroxybutyrate depolymerase